MKTSEIIKRIESLQSATTTTGIIKEAFRHTILKKGDNIYEITKRRGHKILERYELSIRRLK